MITIMWLFVATGIMLIVLSIPLYFEKIPPNGLYGFRVRKTLENKEIWYSVNKYGAIWLIAIGGLQALVAVGFSFIQGWSVDTYALSCLGVFVVMFGIGTVMTVRYLKSL